MLKLVRKSRFKRDFRKLGSSRRDLEKLAKIIRFLQNEESLTERHQDRR